MGGGFYLDVGLLIVMRGRVNVKRIRFDPAHLNIIEVKFVHLKFVRLNDTRSM